MAKAAGATRIFATGRLPHRLEAARHFDATDLMLVDDGREAQAILDATNGRGVEVAFEAADDNAAVEAAVAAMRPRDA